MRDPASSVHSAIASVLKSLGVSLPAAPATNRVLTHAVTRVASEGVSAEAMEITNGNCFLTDYAPCGGSGGDDSVPGDSDCFPPPVVDSGGNPGQNFGGGGGGGNGVCDLYEFDINRHPDLCDGTHHDFLYS
jgi:hypothetical protein